MKTKIIFLFLFLLLFLVACTQKNLESKDTNSDAVNNDIESLNSELGSDLDNTELEGLDQDLQELETF
jgi:PBP1b-binding outer membrane lipoprotein LpoB